MDKYRLELWCEDDHTFCYHGHFFSPEEVVEFALRICGSGDRAVLTAVRRLLPNGQFSEPLVDQLIREKQSRLISK